MFGWCRGGACSAPRGRPILIGSCRGGGADSWGLSQSLERPVGAWQAKNNCEGGLFRCMKNALKEHLAVEQAVLAQRWIFALDRLAGVEVPE